MLQAAITEDANLSPFLDFVISGQGVQLNSSLLQIGVRKMRRDFLAMMMESRGFQEASPFIFA